MTTEKVPSATHTDTEDSAPECHSAVIAVLKFCFLSVIKGWLLLPALCTAGCF